MKNKNNALLQIGITGGIGSGKSTICKVFQQIGIPIYDADYWAKWLMNHNESIKQGLIKEFGEEIFDNNTLQRAYLAKQVFNNADKLALLNSIVHPEVFAHYDAWVNSHAEKVPYVVKEAALMFESESYLALHYIININCELNTRINRVLKRDIQRTKAEVEAIIQKQLSDEQRTNKANYSLNNTGNTPILNEIIVLHQHFLHLSNTKEYGIHL